MFKADAAATHAADTRAGAVGTCIVEIRLYESAWGAATIDACEKQRGRAFQNVCGARLSKSEKRTKKVS